MLLFLLARRVTLLKKSKLDDVAPRKSRVRMRPDGPLMSASQGFQPMKRAVPCTFWMAGLTAVSDMFCGWDDLTQVSENKWIG